MVTQCRRQGWYGGRLSDWQDESHGQVRRCMYLSIFPFTFLRLCRDGCCLTRLLLGCL